MPELSSDDAGYNRQGDDPQRVRRLALRIDDVLPPKAEMQNDRAADRSHPEHEAKRGHIPRPHGNVVPEEVHYKMNANMDIGKHAGLSIDGGVETDAATAPYLTPGVCATTLQAEALPVAAFLH